MKRASDTTPTNVAVDVLFERVGHEDETSPVARRAE